MKSLGRTSLNAKFSKSCLITIGALWQKLPQPLEQTKFKICPLNQHQCVATVQIQVPHATCFLCGQRNSIISFKESTIALVNVFIFVLNFVWSACWFVCLVSHSAAYHLKVLTLSKHHSSESELVKLQMKFHFNSIFFCLYFLRCKQTTVISQGNPQVLKSVCR